MKKNPFTPSKKTIRKPDHTKVTTKLNNNVRKSIAMAQVGADLLPEFDHFSYEADWSNFPSSLMISCHLHPEHCPEDTTVIEAQLSKLLKLGLLKQGIKFRDFRKNVTLICGSETLS
tara:strand:+ start:86 stop:436 length:351 start_codon:yes stop_codon:yes gene_type:complete